MRCDSFGKFAFFSERFFSVLSGCSVLSFRKTGESSFDSFAKLCLAFLFLLQQASAMKCDQRQFSDPFKTLNISLLFSKKCFPAGVENCSYVSLRVKVCSHGLISNYFAIK